jgi:hypothetical protein
MTKLEELKAARDAAWVVYAAARDAAIDAYAIDAVLDSAARAAAYDALDVWAAAYAAYEAELEKTQEENSND